MGLCAALTGVAGHGSLDDLDSGTLALLIESAVAGGVGLFIGLEREHSDRTAPSGEHSDDHLGVRTFAIFAHHDPRRQ